MIVFDLNCAGGHRFEAWFRTSADYEEQIAHNEVACPYCGENRVSKALTAANVPAKGNQRQDRGIPDSNVGGTSGTSGPDGAGPGGRMIGMAELPAPLREELAKTLDKVRRHVEKNCDYVGDDFPEEARKIHYGETEARGIYARTLPCPVVNNRSTTA